MTQTPKPEERAPYSVEPHCLVMLGNKLIRHCDNESSAEWYKNDLNAAFSAGRSQGLRDGMAQELPFRLDNEQIETLRTLGLKPDDIAVGSPKRAGRIEELLHWFLRYSRKEANPKWADSHAYELCYYIASAALSTQQQPQNDEQAKH